MPANSPSRGRQVEGTRRSRRGVTDEVGPAKVLEDTARLAGRHIPHSPAGVFAPPLLSYLPTDDHLIRHYTQTPIDVRRRVD
jgi:hypothetical protein